MSLRDSTGGRRRFLTQALPAGALFCLGCRGLAAGQKPKYLEDAGMTVEDVFKFSYGNIVPILASMAEDLGREKLLKLLEKASAESYTQMITAMAKSYPSRDLKSFVKMNDEFMASLPIFPKSLAYEVTEFTGGTMVVVYLVLLLLLPYAELATGAPPIRGIPARSRRFANYVRGRFGVATG